MASTTLEKVDETRIKMSITIDAGDVDAAIAQAAQRLSQSVKVPGFRPGKPVPMKVLEGRLGKGAVAEEAVRDAFPAIYSQALQDNELTAVSQPQLTVETFVAGQDGVIIAEFDVRPEVTVPDYEGLEIEHPEWEVTEEEVQQNLDAMRDRFAEVDTVERPAQKGDFVTVTITGSTEDGTEVPEASAEDMLYQIPEEDTDSELDTQLPGAEAGAVLEFTDELGPDYGELAGKTLNFKAIVKEVKVKTLPELDDDFALTASEFDTIDELTADLREGMAAEKRQIARQNLRGAVVEKIAEMVEVPLPRSLVDEEHNYRLNRLAHQAQQSGLSFEQFVSIVGGGDPQEMIDKMREEAEQTVRAQLVVDEIGQDAGITVEREDLGEEVARQAMRLGRDPKEVAELMMHPDRIGALYADAYRRKTIDHILTKVEITNAPPPEPEPEMDEEDEAVTAETAEDTGVESDEPVSAEADEADDDQADEADDDQADEASDEEE